MTVDRTLTVWIEQRRVGQLAEHAGLWRFDYDPAWSQAADGFDLSPALARVQGSIIDGASQRSVQWFFDNLLPEEAARTLLAREAQVSGEDAFALLAHYGAESAGALTLLGAGEAPAAGGLSPLDDDALHARIARLPHASLAANAPKRMSLAGAQHKLAVVLREGKLFEPVGNTPSTHILKPDHRDTEDYPHSVANEWFVMQLAGSVGLDVPPVELRHVPDPVYLIERFDRHATHGVVRRRHAIDACQLLDLDRLFKYRAADIGALTRVAGACRSRALTRQTLYRWLVFNLLVGNHDAHLKNLSFLVDSGGIALAPHYDLLCTVLYGSSQDPARWADAELPVALDHVQHYRQLRRPHLLAAGQALGLGRATAARMLDQQLQQLPAAADRLYAELESAASAGASRALHAGELRLLRQIRHLVITDMAAQLRA